MGYINMPTKLNRLLVIPARVKFESLGLEELKRRNPQLGQLLPQGCIGVEVTAPLDDKMMVNFECEVTEEILRALGLWNA